MRLNEGVSVATLFDLHLKRQEQGANERTVNLYLCAIVFFIFKRTTAT